MIRRMTNQRQIVFDSIQLLGHTTTEDLINYINSNYEGISLATIYRNLTVLLEENEIKKVKLKDVEVLETVKEKHYHFTCKKCKSIIDIAPSFIEADSIQNIDGNIVDDILIEFYGVCKNCQQNK